MKPSAIVPLLALFASLSAAAPLDPITEPVLRARSAEAVPDPEAYHGPNWKREPEAEAYRAPDWKREAEPEAYHGPNWKREAEPEAEPQSHTFPPTWKD